MSKIFFPAGVQGKFYNDEGVIIGHSKASIASLVWFIIEVFIVLIGTLIAFVRYGLAELNNMSGFNIYRSFLWGGSEAIPSAYMLSAWLFVVPLIYAIIALRKKTHSKKGIPLFVLSGSICGLLVWVIALVLNFYTLF